MKTSLTDLTAELIKYTSVDCPENGKQVKDIVNLIRNRLKKKKAVFIKTLFIALEPTDLQIVTETKGFFWLQGII